MTILSKLLQQLAMHFLNYFRSALTIIQIAEMNHNIHMAITATDQYLTAISPDSKSSLTAENYRTLLYHLVEKPPTVATQHSNFHICTGMLNRLAVYSLAGSDLNQLNK